MRTAYFLPYTIVFLFCLFSINIQANNPLFDEANTAFTNKKYDDAIAKYEQILKDGLQSAELHFNLANAYFKNNQKAKAMLHFERASRLAPGDADIKFNKVFAKDQLTDDIEAIPSFFLTRWWGNIRDALGSTIWSIISILLLWAGIAGICFWLIGKNRQQKKLGFMGAVAGLALCIPSFFLAKNASSLEIDSRTAIIMPAKVTLRSAPDPSSASIIELHEGTKVKLQDKIEDWYKVGLANGEAGWLNEKELEKI